jgi:hypothetical protein
MASIERRPKCRSCRLFRIISPRVVKRRSRYAQVFDNFTAATGLANPDSGPLVRHQPLELHVHDIGEGRGGRVGTGD